MEKERIVICRVQNENLFEKEDVVAVEQQIEIPLSDGTSISVTCTPSHIEEIIVAKKYLAKDYDTKNCDAEDYDAKHYGTKELQTYLQKTQTLETLTCVELKEIFEIARNSFENPGSLFVETGCAHACALVHRGEVVCCIEDIGRHNALDKVIGYAILHQIPMQECYVFTSGRISGDYLQKVIDAGFFMVVSRAAVTDRAVKLAKEHDITMLGFIRKNTGNIYHEGAVKLAEKRSAVK